MVDCHSEIHVSDVGTLYRVRILDDCVDFDPTLAMTKQLLFTTPSGVLTKTATLTTDGSPATKWYLEYTVVPGDGLGSPAADFHATAGRLKVQAYLAWADGSHFHSTIVTADDQGRELRVYPNLA